MRILVLCKRRPQGRDLFLEPYGRFFHLSRGLVEQGHHVELELLSYDRSAPQSRVERGLPIHTRPAWPSAGLGYVRAMHSRARHWRPDWIIGFSDIWFGALAVWLAARVGARSLVDAYDNFETYHPMIPPVPQLWRASLRRATLVSAAGPQLADLMAASCGGRPVEVIPMAADPDFFPRERSACRRALGLPVDARLIGYTGALEPRRGMETLFAVVEGLQAREPDVRLVLSGRRYPGVEIPPDALWLGYRPPEEVPLLLNSLDLLLVINRASAFGHYSYPSKLYEAMACQIPVVAARLAGSCWILRDHPALLAEPESVSDFVDRAAQLLPYRRYDYGLRQDWDARVARLARLLADQGR